MEKLQAAIARARAQREDADPALRIGAARTPAHTPNRAAGPLPVWEALTPLTLDPRHLARNRIVTIGSNAETTTFDMLRTKILQQMAAKGWTRLAITSPGPGCGKTTTAINLAGSLARQADTRAVLMEMDMRRPSLARLLGQSPPASVFDLLEDRIGFSEQAHRLGNTVALSMNATPFRHPSELFLQTRTSAKLDQIQAETGSDLMLFDMPPMLVSDDTTAFLPQVDCVLILAAAETTTLSQIDQCEREVASQTNVLGVVLNKMRLKDESYGQYGKY